MDSKLPETEGRDPCPIIRKLVDLMGNKISSNLVERHTKILNEFLSCSQYGFVSFLHFKVTLLILNI